MVKYSGSSSLDEVIVVFLGNKFTIAVVVFIQVLIDRVMQDMAIDNYYYYYYYYYYCYYYHYYCFHVTNQVALKVTIFTDHFIERNLSVA